LPNGPICPDFEKYAKGCRAMSQIDDFIRELRISLGDQQPLVDQLAAWFEEVDLGGVENVHDDQFMRAVKAALSLPNSLTEKVQLVFRLMTIGKVEDLDVREFHFGLQ
jgi:hypothetical protein